MDASLEKWKIRGVARDTPDFYASQNFDKRLPNEPVYEGVGRILPNFFVCVALCSSRSSCSELRWLVVGGWDNGGCRVPRSHAVSRPQNVSPKR